MCSFLRCSVAFSSVHFIVSHTFRYDGLRSHQLATPLPPEIMLCSVRRTPRSSHYDLVLQLMSCYPPSTFVNNYANWGYGLHAVSSVQVGLVYVTCEVAVNGLAVMSSKNGFVYISCLLLNVYSRHRPLLCLLAFVLPGRPQF